MTKPIRDTNYLTWETFLVGGISILTCLAFWVFVDKGTSLYTVSVTAAALSYVANHPHFLSSYMLLYWDNRHQVLTKPKFLWAAVMVPALILLAIHSAVTLENRVWMGYVIQFMFLTVGWHYVKQIFGCIIVGSVRRNIFYSKIERNLILLSLYIIWLFNWVAPQTSKGEFEYYGINYASFAIPPFYNDIGYPIVLASVAILVGMHLRKYVNEGVIPAPPAVTAFVALLIWYLPTFQHAGFSYLIPFFHSLQYLVFVTIYKTNETRSKTEKLSEREQRLTWLKSFLGYMTVAGVLGALFFNWLPKGLDTHSPMGSRSFGPTPWLAMFLLFINIHHYFIDNVIWKSDNELVKKNLFAPAKSTEERAEKLSAVS